MKDWQRADAYIGQGALTNSKRPSAFVRGVYPTHCLTGFQHYLQTREIRYIDYICGLGTNILGHRHPRVVEAIKDQVDLGITHSLSTELELEFAEQFREAINVVDSIKILKSGSEGCSAAVRIAMANQPEHRQHVVTLGYHGWHDRFLCVESPANGVPRMRSSKLLEFNVGWHNIGAIIVEPVILDASPERVEWLKALREKCTLDGVILIFDETITAFRFPRVTVSQTYGIRPDLIVLGKALGNGMPISVVGGRKELMDSDYFVSSTFAGETLSIRAAQVVLKEMNSASCRSMWEEGEKFLERFHDVCGDDIKIEGYPTRGAFRGEETTLALFHQEMCRAGVLFGPSWFFSSTLHSETENVIGICREVMRKIKTKEVKLEGELPVKPYATKVRE